MHFGLMQVIIIHSFDFLHNCYCLSASNGGGKVALQNVVQTLGPSVGRHANSTSLPNSAPVIDVLNESHYVFDGKELIDEHCDSDSSITASSNYSSM